MKMSEEMAVRLHRMMWSDMQRELGDDNLCCDRDRYKKEWIDKHFPGEHFMHNCFLCEYVMQQTGKRPLLECTECKSCPIKWPGDNCSLRERDGGVNYLQSPISEILALPARNGEKRKSDRDLVTLAYCNTKMELAKASGLSEENATTDHIKAIKEKAVEEYFEERPGAKLATMDVDDAFKQYAKEQMEPLKQMNDRLTKQYIEFKNCLAKESGLDHDRPVGDHIKKIRDDAFSDGENAERDRIQEKIYEVLLS